MARKISKKDNRYLAKLVTGERAPCAFCLREVDDEITFGKLYAIGDIQCHYFCCLLSCCLIQKGNDEEGLFGFMYSDILAEVERCKKHKCSYCGLSGANLGCSVGACRKQFHVPCGRSKNAVSLYYGSYKSFCQQHAPKQKIPEHIMAKARLRMKVDRIKSKHGNAANIKQDCESECREEMVCVICYEEVEGFPTVNTFWPPCCGKDAWFHRTCLQRMALSAGMHYLKCPLCNDKESFYDAVVNQGYYVPDRDAAWELEQNAFAEIYERAATCSVEACLCPRGRSHDAENGKWDIKLCLLCGSAGAHAHCIADQSEPSKLNALSLDQSEKITEITTLTDQLATKELRNLSIENELENENISMDHLKTCPNESNTSPEQPNTCFGQSNTSDQPNTCFGQSNKSPDQLNTCSAHSNTSDQLNTCFGQSNTSDQLNTSLGQSNTSDQLNTSLSQSNTSPDQLKTCFGQSNTSPDRLNTSLGQSNTSPEQLNTSLGQSNTCSDKSNTSVRFVCRSCLPAAPADLNALASSIEAIIQQEQMQSTTEVRRPVMPSRMSLRRTKGRRALTDRPSTSRSIYRTEAENVSSESPNVVSSRLELNLKPPRRLHSDPVLRESIVGSKLLSPLKLLEQSFREKMVCTGVRDAVLDDAVVETLRRKFRKPRPMCERKRIVNDILDGVFDNLMKDPKQKEQVKEWCSPKKCFNSIEDSKELEYEISVTPKEENYSNMSNTTSKDPKNIKIEDVISNIINVDENIKNVVHEHQNDVENMKNIDVTFTLVNYVDNFKNSDEKQNDIKIEESSVKNTTEQWTSKNNMNTQCNTEIEEMSRKNSEDNCKIERNSSSETDIKNVEENYNENNDTNKIEDIRTNAIECCRTTRNSIKIFNNSNDNIGNNSKNNTNETEIKNETPKKTKESVKKLKKSITESVTEKGTDIIEIDDSTKTQTDDAEKQINRENKTDKLTKKPSRKRKHSRRRKIKPRGVEKPKHITTKNKPFRETPKVRSKSESSADINILKRLLTEKDLCSQLLLELTTGKANENKIANTIVSDTNKTISDVQNNSAETPKIINATNSLYETQKHSRSSKSLDTIQKSTNLKYPETPKSSRETPKNSKTTPNRKNSVETSMQGTQNSDQSLTKSSINDTKHFIAIPNHKAIEMKQDSSLEIFENNHHINIDVKTEDSPATDNSYKNSKIKLPEQLKSCFKFSPIEDSLAKIDIGIDLESFKKEYLSEVDREFKCSFKHKHVEKGTDKRRFRSPIDFAMDAAIKKDIDPINKKRKLSESGVKMVFDNSVKRRKISESCLQLGSREIPDKCGDQTNKTVENNEGRKKTDKEKRRKKEAKRRKANKRKSTIDKNIEVTIDSSEKRSAKNKRIKKKIKTKFAIQNENIQVKIKWKKKQFSLNIESKKQAKKEKKNKNDYSKFKQYVLQFPEGTSKEVLVKPEKGVCPLKRKYIRNEKSPDKMKQLSIQNFFKIKPER